MSRVIITFGELSVRWDDQEPAELGGTKPRLLLALLLSRVNAVFPADDLIDGLWAGHPPRTARKNLQVYVSRLRRILGDRVEYGRGGYLLRLSGDECDLVRFEELAREGRRLARDGETAAAAGPLDEALSLWQGRPLAELGRLPCLADALEQLEELFWGTLEEWAEIACDRGDFATVRERLQDHAPAQPLRERLGAAWMRALAASGRTGEAMAHFEAVRRELARELGVEPGPTLTDARASLAAGAFDGPGGSPARRGAGNQLPRATPDFVGRSAEVHRVLSCLGGPAEGGANARAAGGGVMVVTGPVGVGKSALALRAGHLLAENFPDGVLYAELGTRPLGTVLHGLLNSAGLPEDRGVAKSLARWRSWITSRRVLLVLDDAVSATVAEALLPGCGPSAALVTSRYRLSALTGVTTVQLAPLTEAEGMELLGRVIGLGRLLADPLAAARIVGRCEGLPLAIRIAGVKMTTLRHLRPAEYADRLCGAPWLLDEMTAGELVLKERYEAFWRALPAPSRAACRRLAAQPPPYRHEQVTADAEELLECSLLTSPPAEVSAHIATYGMSVFAREFARRYGGTEREAAAPSP